MGWARDVVRVVAGIGCAVVVAGCTGAGPTTASGTGTPSGATTPSGTTAGSGPTAAPSPSPSPAPSVSLSPSEIPAEPVFAATATAITPELAVRMAASWREGCPVPLADLRYLTVTYRGFDGAAHEGELVVHADAADAITQVFRTLFELGYPIRSLRLVDDFGADDDASMAADNTSAFNCRAIAGTRTWSQHAYGRAIDVNPVENPYVSSSGVYPAAGADFVSRPDLPGVLHAGDAAVTAFARAGWPWGGAWPTTKDYQHFSATGE